MPNIKLKSHKKDLLPENFTSFDEFDEFWNSHSSADYEDQMTPVMALVNYTSEQFNLFAERMLRGTVEGIEMGGKPDGMIASGFREPKTPYFCFHEYKRDEDPEGDSAGQALAAMLVAQALNEHPHPIYGCYVKGRDWFFMVLQGKQYAISEPYIATREDVFDIFRILKALKPIIADFVAQDVSIG